MLDEYVFGEAERLSPEAPVPVLHIKHRSWSAGGAGNVALHLAKLGAHVTLLGARGDDAPGRRLEKLLLENRITCALVTSNDTPTTLKTRYVAGKHQLLRSDVEEFYLDEKTAIEQAMAVNADHQPFDAVLVSDYGKGFCSAALCRVLLENSKKKNIPVIIDPKGMEWNKYDGAFLVTPNLREFEMIAGEKTGNTDAGVEASIDKVRMKYSFENLLVTRSERGMTLLHGQQTTHFPTQAIDVFDVTGAGDTVLAVVSAVYALLGDLAYACQVANLAAGFVVGKFGAYSLNRGELLALLDKHDSATLEPDDFFHSNQNE